MRKQKLPTAGKSSATSDTESSFSSDASGDERSDQTVSLTATASLSPTDELLHNISSKHQADSSSSDIEESLKFTKLGASNDSEDDFLPTIVDSIADKETILQRELEKLKEKNKCLQKKLQQHEDSLKKERKKNQLLSSEVKSLRKKEQNETNALEEMILKVEENLTAANKRSVLAESTITKLKKEIQILQAELAASKNPQVIRQNYEELILGVREKANYASQQLAAASHKADLQIRELCQGVETLKHISELLFNIDSSFEVKT